MTRNGRNAVLLILIDALPWALVQRTGFLKEIAPFRGPLETVLGYSTAALPTLLSGKMPEEHGHWTMYHLDSRRSPFGLYKPLLWLARTVGREGFVRRFVERALPVSSRLTGYFKLYEVPLDLLPQLSLAQRDDIFSPGGLGTVRSIFDELSERGVEHRTWTWRTEEEKSFAQALKILSSGSAGVFFIYTPELDAVMHAEGVFSGKTLSKLREQESRVAGLYRRARERCDRVSLLVFSDHGMADVTESHDLMALIASQAGFRAPGDYIAFYDSTIARFWGMKQGALGAIADVLGRLDYGRVLDRRELGELGLAFDGAAYGELVFLLDAGHIILPSFMGREKPAAMHGYHPEHAMSSAVYMSNVPPKVEPRHIRDMYGVMVDAVDSAMGPVGPSAVGTQAEP